MLSPLVPHGDGWKAQVLRLDHASERTGRIYSREQMVAALLSINSQTGCELGQIGQRDGYQIDIANASHQLKELAIEDDCLVATIKFLNTPRGMYGQTLCALGVPLQLMLVAQADVDINKNVSNITIVGVDIIEP